jgi:putative oxidoreductase
MKSSSVICWAARLVASLIMLQTLYFKFTASEESVFIFTTVGMEPWGRIGIGVLELVASLLILFNSTAWLGAVLALGLMGGAIVIHLTSIGISVRDDGGYLFALAIIVACCSIYVLWCNKHKILNVIRLLKK